MSKQPKHHPSLANLLKRHFGNKERIPEELRAFIQAVDTDYQKFDGKQTRLEASGSFNEIDNEGILSNHQQLRRLNKLLVTAAKSKQLASGDLDTAFREITNIAVRGLDIERASIWLYDDDHSKLSCVNLYIKSSDHHSHGLELFASEYPIYFEALSNQRTIAADDALAHPSTAEFTENYLKPLGISSMLDATIRVGGKVVGVVCNERVGPARKWTQEEVNFAGSMADFASLAMETRAREKAQRAFQESENKFRILSETTDSIIVVFRKNFIYTNPTLSKVTGYSNDEILSMSPSNLVHEDYRPMIDQLIDHYKTGSNKTIRKEIRILDRKGNEHWMFLTTNSIQFEGELAVLGMAFDISELKAMEDKLRYQAFHDKLTKLPNRAMFTSHLEKAIARTKRHKNLFAVLFIDLDRFKVVNDSLGHPIGDKLLIKIAGRLKDNLQAADTVTRLGGDEFAVLIQDLNCMENAITIANRVQKIISKPLNIGNHEVILTASIGITFSNSGHNRADSILRDGDIAMYRAKSNGKARYEIFNEEMHTGAKHRLALENDLRRAIKQQEFELYYQPIVTMQSGSLAGFEALIRWNHPERGQVSPLEFIPLAEETGMIGEIGTWVLIDACKTIKQWQLKLNNTDTPPVNINVSGKQLAHGNLASQVINILDNAGIDGSHIKLELTETLMMENHSLASTMIKQLKQHRVRIAIDDFGTGYSSLSYLHKLPIDTLKVDRSFINDIDEKGRKSEIVNTIVMLAHSLGLDVVAEGIETEHQQKHLQTIDCEYAQGYLFNRPMPADQALDLLLKEENQSWNYRNAGTKKMH